MMEETVELPTNAISEESPLEKMDLPPVIENMVMDAASALMGDTIVQNPYVDEMITDGLTLSDIDFFTKSFLDLNNVKYEKIHCTCCNKHIGTAPESTPERFKHPLLNVIICEDCYLFYCSGDFEKDKDGSELYCRWCGEGGQVFCCSKCPYVFCKKCISRNLGRGTATIIENSDDWLCFNCNPCQISKQRATCWAMAKYTQEAKEQAEQCPQLKPQLTSDFSACCKTKRLASKSSPHSPAAKRARLRDSPNLSASILKEAIMCAPDFPAFDWPNAAEPEDEVICTPDIMPYDDSPPGSPPPLMPVVSYSPPPTPTKVTPINIVKKTPAPKAKPQARKVAATTIKPVVVPVPEVTVKKVATNNVVKSPVVLNTSTSTPITGKTITNTIKTTAVKEAPSTSTCLTPLTFTSKQKVTLPTPSTSTTADEQWFGTGVIKSAEVTEYISSKVSRLACMHSQGEVTDDKKEEIFRTFQSHLDVAISKLKTVKHTMNLSYNKVKKKVMNPYAAVKPTRAAARKKRVSYVDSSSDDADWKVSDKSSDEEYSSDSLYGKRHRKKKTTPEKNENANEPAKVVEVVQHTVLKVVQPFVPKPIVQKPIIQKPIIQKPTVQKVSLPKPTHDDKIILDVIDLIDDNSLDPLDIQSTSNDAKNASEELVCTPILPTIHTITDDECDDVPDIDSDISEILPDHLMFDKNSDKGSDNEISDTEIVEKPSKTTKRVKIVTEIIEDKDYDVEEIPNDDNITKEDTDKEDKTKGDKEAEENNIDTDKDNNKEDMDVEENIKDKEVENKEDTDKEETDKEDMEVEECVAKTIDDNVKNVSEEIIDKDKDSDEDKEKVSDEEKANNSDEEVEKKSDEEIGKNSDEEIDKNSDEEVEKNQEDKEKNSDVETDSEKEVISKNSPDKDDLKEITDDLKKMIDADDNEIIENKVGNSGKTLENDVKNDSSDDDLPVKDEALSDDELSESEDKIKDNSGNNNVKSPESEEIEDGLSGKELNSFLSAKVQMKESKVKENGQNETDKKDEKEESDKNFIEEDFEAILTTNTIVTSNKTSKVNFGAEFSKFVSNVNNCVSDDEDASVEEINLDKELDMVSRICEEDDDALSLPPQNTVDFDLDYKDNDSNSGKKGSSENSKNNSDRSEKTGLENELNVLRKLAENCIVLNAETITSDSKLCKS